MRDFLILIAIIMSISSCQKDNLAESHNVQEHSHNSTDYSTNLETRDNEYTVSGRVWEDLDGDGLQDFDEPIIEDVILQLKRVEDNVTVQEYVTDDSGQYFFDIEGEGDYFISITLSPFTPGYIATKPDVILIESLDSDVTHDFGKNTSESFSHDYNGVLDFGFYKGGVIGNMVWVDSDFNSKGGIQNFFDGSDAIFPGAIIRLYSINLLNGIETLLKTTVTDANGQYLFQSLEAAIYFIEIEINSDGTNLTNNFIFVTPNFGDDDSRDSDIVEIIKLGSQQLIGRTGFIHLGVEEINLDIDIGIEDNSAVICFFPPGAIGSSGGSATPNGTVWIDENNDGFRRGDEPGMPGVIIQLIDAADETVVQSVISNSEGYYSFERIDNSIASCYLQISQPTGYMLTKNTRGSCYPTSDFDQKTRKTIEFRTSACPYYSSYDAGLVDGVLVLGRGQ